MGNPILVPPNVKKGEENFGKVFNPRLGRESKKNPKWGVSNWASIPKKVNEKKREIPHKRVEKKCAIPALLPVKKPGKYPPSKKWWPTNIPKLYPLGFLTLVGKMPNLFGKRRKKILIPQTPKFNWEGFKKKGG